MKIKKWFGILSGTVIICCLAAQGWADDTVNFGDRMPTEAELLDAWAPDDPPETVLPSENEVVHPEGHKRRGIRPRSKTEDGAVSRGIRPTPVVNKPQVKATPAIKPRPKPVSMEITFERNSYELTWNAKRKLDVVGRSLNTDRLRDFYFTIEGHTDASGSDAYNMHLSRQRAQSVKDYLVIQFNVDPNRLNAIGKGETDLLLVNNPNAAANRRVKIIRE